MYLKQHSIGGYTLRVPARTPHDATLNNARVGHKDPDGNFTDSPFWPLLDQISPQNLSEISSLRSVLTAAVRGQAGGDPYGREIRNSSLLKCIQEDAITFSGIMEELFKRDEIGVSIARHTKTVEIPQKRFFTSRRILANEITEQPMWLILSGKDLSNRPMVEYGVRIDDDGIKRDVLVRRWNDQTIEMLREKYIDSSHEFFRRERAIGIIPGGVLVQVHRERVETVASRLENGVRDDFDQGENPDFANGDELFKTSSLQALATPQVVRVRFLLRTAKAIVNYTDSGSETTSLEKLTRRVMNTR